MTKPNIINTPLGCKLLTTILLNKNILNHRKVKKATGKGILLNGCQCSYQYMKQLLQEHPEVMDTVAVMQDRNITYRELWDES